MSDRRVPRYYEHISANADQHLLESGPVDGGHDLDRNAVRVGVESQVQKSDPRGGQGREPRNVLADLPWCPWIVRVTS